jgi:hypothetical protein
MSSDLIWVKATAIGQKPNKAWANVGDVFKVEEAQFSESWMAKLTDDEVKAREASGDVGDAQDAEMAELKAKLADAEAGRAIAMEAADLLQVEVGELLDKISEIKTAPAAAPKRGRPPKGEGANAAK